MIISSLLQRKCCKCTVKVRVETDTAVIKVILTYFKRPWYKVGGILIVQYMYFTEYYKLRSMTEFEIKKSKLPIGFPFGSGVKIGSIAGGGSGSS